jgi:hypothetical protein
MSKIKLFMKKEAFNKQDLMQAYDIILRQEPNEPINTQAGAVIADYILEESGGTYESLHGYGIDQKADIDVINMLSGRGILPDSGFHTANDFKRKGIIGVTSYNAYNKHSHYASSYYINSLMPGDIFYADYVEPDSDDYIYLGIFGNKEDAQKVVFDHASNRGLELVG